MTCAVRARLYHVLQEIAFSHAAPFRSPEMVCFEVWLCRKYFAIPSVTASKPYRLFLLCSEIWLCRKHLSHTCCAMCVLRHGMVVQEVSEPYLPCLDNPSFTVFKCDDLKVGESDTCEDGEQPKRYTCSDFSEDFVTTGTNGTCEENGAHACGACPAACGSCDLCYQVYILFVTGYISRLILDPVLW